MDILYISHKGVHNSENNFKNFEEQPSGPEVLEFLEACIAARTSSGINEGTSMYALVR